jgi:hypothetical protein
MSKHTPGPWELVEHEHEPAEIRGSETGLQLAHVFCTDHDFGKANAKLIAASPELLAACELVAGCRTNSNDTIDALREAICKAKGWAKHPDAVAKAIGLVHA